jgi:hypothetical protein
LVSLRYGAGIGVQLFGVVAFLGFSYAFWLAGMSGFPAAIWFSFTVVSVAFLLISGTIKFQTTPPRVFRQWRFPGFIPVWQRDYSLDTFTGVQRRRRRGPEPQDSTWRVGLVERSGGFLAVQWFSTDNDGVCSEADRYATELAGITGLPLIEAAVVHTRHEKHR